MVIKQVEKYIEALNLLPPKATVIVGLSGGQDSMALLDILTLLDYRCIAAHCNFHLRGEESKGDANFVRRWCKSVDIEHTSIDFDTEQYAIDKKISIEMAARELRYRWFEIVRQQYNADAIAVAHHRDDSVETVLMNMIRGTGIKGMTGISPRNGNVVRPLLALRQQDIADYLNDRGIPYRHDSSNDHDVFLRNDIRLNVIPMLENINPSVKEAIFQTSHHIYEAWKVYDRAMAKMKNEVFDGKEINIEALKETSSPLSVLFEILSPMGFASSTIEDILANIDAQPGKQFYAGQTRLIKDRHSFILTETGQENKDAEYHVYEGEPCAELPVKMTVSIVSEWKPMQKDRQHLYADADKLHFPLKLRRWRQGDWFVPFGMKGTKKLSDYFTDRKLSIADKEDVWILTSADDIVWIVGERLDDRFKITPNTKKALVIKLGDEKPIRDRQTISENS